VTIKFHSEARKAVFEASDYYEEQVVGLGDVFIDEVEKYWMQSSSSQLRGPKSQKLNEDF
jgi:hypothetical protein